jgi:transposase-like protein
MATLRTDITSFVGKLLEEDDIDLLREGVRVLAQAIIETEVSSQTGAPRYERPSSRSHHSGYRTRTWDARVGTIELKIPQGPHSSACSSPSQSREGAARGRGRGLREGKLHA